MRKLSDLSNGERGVVQRVGGNARVRKRLLEMGFVKGASLRVIRRAPLQDPMEIEMKGFHLGLREQEAKVVEVESV